MKVNFHSWLNYHLTTSLGCVLLAYAVNRLVFNMVPTLPLWH